MPTFSIDNDNNITAHGTPEEAAAANAAPFESFSSQKELAQLVVGWPPERLVAIWNSLPGVAPEKTFKSAKIAASRIWERIQGLGEAAKPKEERKAKGGARAAKGAPAKAKATKKAAKSQETAAPREGSKTACSELDTRLADNRKTLVLNYGGRRIGDTQVELLLGADCGKLPRLDLSALSDAELYRELGRRRRAKRKVHRGGPAGRRSRGLGVREVHPGLAFCLFGPRIEPRGYSCMRSAR